MPVYQNAAGSGIIGTLLRQIQEDRQTNPAAIPPANDPNSPIRNLVQQPLQQVESPDSSRIAQVRPETPGVAVQPGQPGGVVPDPNVVAPAAPIAPVMPSAPAPSATPGGSSIPGTPSVSAPSAPVRAASPFNLSQSIMPSSINRAITVSRPSATPTPSPAPSRPAAAPAQSRIGPLSLTTGFSGLAQRILPTLENLGRAALGKIGTGVAGLDTMLRFNPGNAQILKNQGIIKGKSVKS